MPSQTGKYDIPYAIGTDPVRDGDDAMQDMAEKLDLLLGEHGEDDITPSAPDTNTSLRIDYARDYTTAPAVPTVIAVLHEQVAVPNDVNVWVTLEDETGFTLNIRASTTTTRTVRWTARP